MTFHPISAGASFGSLQTLSSSSTITTAGLGFAPCTNSGPVTGIIMQAGTSNGQEIVVINVGSGTITFATSGTSNVAAGTSASIAAGAMATFAWDSTAWYTGGFTSGTGLARNTTAGNIQPDGVQTAGAVGTAADAGHIHNERAWLPLLLTGSGALAESIPRMLGNVSFQLAANTTGYFSAIPLYKGMTVAHLTFTVSGTVEVTGSHGWYMLTDSSLNVLAVTADQTGTPWGSANTDVTLAVTIDGTNPYVVANSGFYYAGVCTTAATRPSFLTNTIITNINSSAPHPLGFIATVTSTPPAVGSVVTLGANNNSIFYAYAS